MLEAMKEYQQDNVNYIKEFHDSLKTSMDEIKTLQQKGYDDLNNLQQLIQNLSKHNDDNHRKVLETIENNSRQIKQEIQTINQQLQERIQQVQNAIGDNRDSLRKLHEILSSIAIFLQNLDTMITKDFQTLYDLLQTRIQELRTSLMDQIYYQNVTTKQAVIEKANEIVRLIHKLMESITAVQYQEAEEHSYTQALINDMNKDLNEQIKRLLVINEVKQLLEKTNHGVKQVYAMQSNIEQRLKPLNNMQDQVVGFIQALLVAHSDVKALHEIITDQIVITKDSNYHLRVLNRHGVRKVLNAQWGDAFTSLGGNLETILINTLNFSNRMIGGIGVTLTNVINGIMSWRPQFRRSAYGEYSEVHTVPVTSRTRYYQPRTDGESELRYRGSRQQEQQATQDIDSIVVKLQQFVESYQYTSETEFIVIDEAATPGLIIQPDPEPVVENQPIPEQPIPEQPAPEQPAPEQPTPEQPIPEPPAIIPPRIVHEPIVIQPVIANNIPRYNNFIGEEIEEPIPEYTPTRTNTMNNSGEEIEEPGYYPPRTEQVPEPDEMYPLKKMKSLFARPTPKEERQLNERLADIADRNNDSHEKTMRINGDLDLPDPDGDSTSF